MPSTRRVKGLSVAFVLAVLCLLYFSSSGSSSNKQFYDRTVEGLKARSLRAAGPEPASPDHVRTEQVQRPMKAPVEDNKGNRGADEESVIAPDRKGRMNLPKDGKEVDESETRTRLPPQVVIGADGESKGVSGGEKWDMGPSSDENEDKEYKQTAEDIEVESVLNDILKKGPIIIFSKSYCPYSKKAKHIFAQYEISPSPYVVELDDHELGLPLQEKLHKITGRRTVPNVLINGASIGGGDDVEALHDQGALIDKIKEYGGKRIMEARLKAGNVRARLK